MTASFRRNRLQLKVTLVILVIVVVPMLIAGIVSAAWVSNSFERSIEGWIREASQVNEDAVESLQRNATLVGRLLARRLETGRGGVEPALVPPDLQELVRALGINLIQRYGSDRKPIGPAHAVHMRTQWDSGQTQAILKVRQGEQELLAAVAIMRIPHPDRRHGYLIVGTLLDREFLARLARMSGLRTRLFYPQGSEYAKAFSETDPPLQMRLPPEAYRQLEANKPYYNGVADVGRYRGLYTPVVDSTGHLEAVLFSGLETHGIDVILMDRMAITLIIGVLGLLIGAAAGWLLGRIVVRPVGYLRDGVVQLAAQDFRAQVPIHSQDELGDLARSFNAMAVSLREARDEQRREFQRDKIAALGELSVALAHEIRNPLGVINTAASLLTREGADPAKQGELLRMVREEATRLNQLLKDFQQLARHRRPELSRINAIEPLEKALRLALAGPRPVTVERPGAPADLTINADPELLQQAWTNLLNNAFQAMGEAPGTLTLTAGREGAEVWVALEDSGPGIPVEVMARLFEPFYTTKTGGTGLGLTIANTLVEACGGRLELMPSKGRGARFAMRFPAA